ncbi:acyltransferase family protein [Chryseobacterium potabilaquae]|uniref:acyltransferase family protein n=1 Tax=Chryseobacterium potabilaquae TaxID=2675057 RepID=UPI00138A33C8|nr:acyltransferase [Chryseobacterium potabilaquae]
MKKEIDVLTGLRGISALWVIFHHYFSLPPTQNIALKAIENTLSNGYLAVDFFFILSSFVLCYSYEKYFREDIKKDHYKEFIIKRFIRIYPMLIFIVLVSFLFLFKDHWRYFPFYISLTFIFLAEKYRVISSLGITWSLSCELILYFIFPFLFLYFQKRKHYLTLIIPLAIVLFYYVYFFDTITFSTEGLVYENIHNSKGLINTPYGLSAIVRCFAGYLLGILSFHFYKSGRIINISWGLFIIIISLLLKKMDVIILISFSFSLSSIIQQPQIFISKILSSKWALFLGKISYSIYLIHIIPLLILDSHKTYLLQFLPLFVYKFFCIILTIGISVITYYMIEIRFSQLLKNFFIKKHPENEHFRSLLRKK